MKAKNRFLSLFMAATLIISLFPQVSFATADKASSEPAGDHMLVLQEEEKETMAEGKAASPETDDFNFEDADAVTQSVTLSIDEDVYISGSSAEEEIPDSDYIIKRDFSNGVSDVDAMNAGSTTTGFRYGHVSTSLLDADDSLNSKISGTGSEYNGAFLYGDNYQSGRPSTSLGIKGNIIFETEMKFDNLADGIEIYPLSIVPDVYSTGSYTWNFAENILQIKNGACYVNYNKILDLEENKYYKFKITMSIDGDETTTNDPFVTSISDGTNTYTGSGVICKTRNQSNKTSLKEIHAINVLRVMNNTQSDVNVYIKNIMAYYFQPPEVEASIEDGATNIKSGSEIVLDFGREMDTSTFSNINLVDAEGQQAGILNIEIPDDETAIVTLPNTLASQAAYKLVIPATVLTKSGLAVSKTINFTSAEVDYITYTNASGTYSFNYDLTVENSSAVSAIADRRDAGWRGFRDARCGSIWTPSVSYDTTKRAWKIPSNTNIASNAGYPSSLLYGYSKSSGVEYFLEDVSGNIVLEAEMAFDNVGSGTNYLPIAFIPDTGAVNNAFNFASNMIRISGGKAYIANTDKNLTIEADKFYKFRITLQLDGNSATVNDPFTAEISDGNNVLASGSGTLSTTGILTTFAASLASAASIKAINVVAMQNTTADSAAAYVRYIKGYYTEVPEFTASIAEGETNVELDHEIVLTFTDEMDASKFTGIELSQGENAVDIEVSPDKGSSTTCTIKVIGGLKANRQYTLRVPAVNSAESNLSSVSKEINFTTKPYVLPVMFSNLTVNGGEALNITAGAEITVSAELTNNTHEKQNASIIVGIYNKDNKLQKLTFGNKELLGDDMNIKAEAKVTVPDGIGEDAYIRVFSWNSLSGMDALADMIVLPQE